MVCFLCFVWFFFPSSFPISKLKVSQLVFFLFNSAEAGGLELAGIKFNHVVNSFVLVLLPVPRYL